MPVADFETARGILQTAFLAQWDILHPEVSGVRDVPVAWPNRNFDPHKDFDSGTQLGWVKFAVLTLPGYAASSSGAKVRQRTEGFVVVQVFVPSGTGDAVAVSIADDAVSALQYKTLSGVVCTEATPLPVGRTDEGFYQINVTTDFRYDTLVSTT